MRDLQKTIAQLRTDQRLQAAGIHAPFEKQSELPSSDELSRQLDQAIPKFIYGLANLSSDSERLASQVLKHAQEVKERRERYYKVSNWASYALYGLGWAIGLLARIFSGETVAQDS